MSALKDPQYEKFAAELAELKPPIEAYKLAGFVPHRGNANRLSKRPEIKARVQQLLDEAAEYADIRRVRVLVEIDRVGKANIADFYEADGKTLKNITQMPRRLTAAIAGINWIEDGVDADGKVTYRAEIKFHDKNQANFTLLKHLGGLPEAERNDVNIFNLLSVEDQRIVVAALEAQPGGQGAISGATESEPQPA
jgi:hypothetical protein